MLRAIHQLFDGEPKILDDPVSLRILAQEIRDHLHERLDEFQAPYRRVVRSHTLIRSRFAEDQLAEAFQRGVGQYVLLGAGLDTFAHRQPAWAASLRIFELDHQASQMAKRESLRAAGISAPPNLTYVAADLEQDALQTALEAAGYDSGAPAFFSCLGVTMYLASEAVRSMLQFVASTPGRGEIVFTFVLDKPVNPLRQRTLHRRATAEEEPWPTKFQPDRLDRILRDLGFSEIVFLSPERMAERYLQGRSDGLPTPGRASIVSARV